MEPVQNQPTQETTRPPGLVEGGAQASSPIPEAQPAPVATPGTEPAATSPEDFRAKPIAPRPPSPNKPEVQPTPQQAPVVEQPTQTVETPVATPIPEVQTAPVATPGTEPTPAAPSGPVPEAQVTPTPTPEAQVQESMSVPNAPLTGSGGQPLGSNSEAESIQGVQTTASSTEQAEVTEEGSDKIAGVSEMELQALFKDFDPKTRGNSIKAFKLFHAYKKLSGGDEEAVKSSAEALHDTLTSISLEAIKASEAQAAQPESQPKT